ncbi:MAG: methyltransferase domain-containing protein [Chitinophagaceae bacterium]
MASIRSMNMTDNLELRHIKTGGLELSLFVPEPAYIQHTYYNLVESNKDIPFPYWAKLWPSSLAMAIFLQQQTGYIKDKKVLELAAGLGLPSLVAAKYADRVCCSDYIADAVKVMQQTMAHHKLSNVECRVLNWHRLPADLTAEVLLLSDINYDPFEFDILFHVIKRFMETGTTIILSTPQRLMAKTFIERLLPWCVKQEEIAVPEGGQDTMISVLVLGTEVILPKG